MRLWQHIEPRTLVAIPGGHPEAAGDRVLNARTAGFLTIDADCRHATLANSAAVISELDRDGGFSGGQQWNVRDEICPLPLEPIVVISKLPAGQ